MSVRVRCSQCQTAYLVPDGPRGAEAVCPKCGAVRKPAAASAPPRIPPAPTTDVEAADPATSVFRPSAEATERKSSRRKWVLVGLLMLVLTGAAGFLAFWPNVRKRSNDPVEQVAEAYLQALVDRDEEAQKRLSVMEDPPAIRAFFDPSRDKPWDSTVRGSFAPIAALHKRIDGQFAYDPTISRFTPRNPLGAAGETLDALHEAKAGAEKSGLYDKMASGDPDDLFDAAEGLGKVFENLAQGALAPKKILPTYKMLVEDSKPPLPAESRTLALAVADAPQTWDGLLKRPFFTLKADGPFILDRAEVDVQVVDALGSPGDPPTPMRLSFVRFQLEGIDTSWRVVSARRILPGVPDEPQAEPDHDPSAPVEPAAKPSLGSPPSP